MPSNNRSGKNRKDAAYKEKIAARRKVTQTATVPIEQKQAPKPVRDHWLNPESYSLIPAIRELGTPIYDPRNLFPFVIEALVDERKAMITLENDPFNKRLQQLLEEKQDFASAGISRHFRKASVRVHPDRHGDRYLQEFDRLKDAYEIMKDAALRTDYSTHMLDQVLIYETQAHVRAISPNFFQDSHQDWLKKYETKQEQDTAQVRYQQHQQGTQRRQTTMGNSGPQKFYVEASSRERPPGRSFLYGHNARSRTVQLGLQFDNIEDLLPSVHEIVITAWPTLDEGAEIEVERLQKERLQPLFDLKEDDNPVLRVPLSFDHHCEWFIQWNAVLYIPGRQDPYVDTASTRHIKVDLTHPAYERSRKEYSILLQLAKKNASTLSRFCEKLVAKESNNVQILEQQSWELHRLLSNGRLTRRRLFDCLEILMYNVDNCKELDVLLQACEKAVHTKSILDQHVFAGQRKNVLKSFKKSVATMIESGELSEWLETVELDELKNHGGEVNRLFQLLVEGKKANSLLVDVTALRKAAERKDLFSEKQCQFLLDRAVQADAQLVIETERMVVADEERKRNEAERSRLEARAEGMVRRGSVVELFGLQNRSDLNGTLGLYMGIATTAEDRYIVQLMVDRSEVSLKKSNFRPFEDGRNGGGASPSPSTRTPSKGTASSPQATLMDPSTKSKPRNKHSRTSKSKANLSPSNPSPKASSEAMAPEEANASNPFPADLPIRKNATWIPKKKFKDFIGPYGENHKKLVQVTKVHSIGVKWEETYTTSDGQIWTLVKVSGRNTSVAIKAINDWVATVSLKKNAKAQSSSLSSSSADFTSQKSESFVDQKQNLKKVAKSSQNNRTSPTSLVEPVEDQAMNDTSSIRAMTKCRSNQSQQLGRLRAQPKPGSSPTMNRSSSPASKVATMDTEGAAIASSSGLLPTAKNTALGQSAMIPGLMTFLTDQAGSFKTSPEAFFDYLTDMDIESMQDLSEAVSDNEVMSDMIDNGLKKFKKGAFKKAILAAKAQKASLPPLPSTKRTQQNDASMEGCTPDGLTCPISFQLMTADPVLASDGRTYERAMIEEWFRRNQGSGQQILSPMTGEPLPSLELRSNFSVRNMAREHERSLVAK